MQKLDRAGCVRARSPGRAPWAGARTGDGAGQRAPNHDYEFSVTQRRYGDRWESIKVQHRRLPEYDGSAGARDQVHYFKI